MLSFTVRVDYAHIVPTELNEGGVNVFYKHIVPTGLNMGQFQSP